MFKKFFKRRLMKGLNVSSLPIFSKMLEFLRNIKYKYTILATHMFRLAHV